MATVSRAMNEGGEGQISPRTRERIQRVASEIGYRPNANARALVRQQTNTIGVVLPPSGNGSALRDSLFSSLLEGVLEAATERHRNTMVFTGQTWQDARSSLSKFRDGRCDGLILFYQPAESDMIPSLLDADVPFVLVNDRRDDARLSWVDVDNEPSARIMTEYLLDRGHKRIALLTQNTNFAYIQPRIDGYQAALEASGISYDENLVVKDQYSWLPESIAAGVDSLLALPKDKRPTALFCTTDDIAISAMTVLYQRGIRVPEDISVAGFNDDSNAIQQHPPLTTMRQPYLQLGGQAVDFLLLQVDDISHRGRTAAIPAELVTRGSTMPR